LICFDITDIVFDVFIVVQVMDRWLGEKKVVMDRWLAEKTLYVSV